MPEKFFVTWNAQVGSAMMKVAGAAEDEFILEDGSRVFDFLSTSFQASFGHNNEVIRSHIHRQLDQMPIATPKSLFALKQRVSSRLLQLLSVGGDPDTGRLFYTVSGAEAVENALKIARHFTGRPKILARTRSYHGATLGAMSVSGDWRSHDHLNFSDGTIRIPEPDDDPGCERTGQIVEASGADQVAAVIVETISGVNGVIIPKQTWWNGLQAICRRYGILLIADEVLCGFGRTGPTFAFQHFDLQPDMVCLSKSISGGYVPFGALWTNERVACHYDRRILACGLTCYAHPLGLAALEGVMDEMADPTFVKRKLALETCFAAGLQELVSLPQVSQVRSKGLLAAIDLHVPAPGWDHFLSHGLHLFSKDRMLILAPPFVSKPERLKQALEVLRQRIQELGC